MAYILFYNADATEQQRFTELLQGSGHEYDFVEEELSLEHSNPNVEVISIFVSDKVTREVMGHFPKLKLIATRSTGYDHIDMQAAKEKGITVVTVPRYGEKTVAEYTFALLMSLSRKLTQTQEAVREGYIEPSALSGFDLDGKTLGIVGTGKIGQHVAKIARGFAMRVIAFDLFPNEAKAAELDFTYVSLDELAAQSDVISLHAPATDETYHLVDKEFLARVKSSAVLVNTARGELVDTHALVEALGGGLLAGAALDVLEHESLLLGFSAEHTATNESAQTVIDIASLRGMPNVLITPHNAFNTREAVDRIRQTTVQNIIDFYKGSTPNKIEV
jgi:D-lactate dehydrogenase